MPTKKAQQSRIWRERLRAAGICTRCAKEPIVSGSFGCASCIAKNKASKRRYYAEHPEKHHDEMCRSRQRNKQLVLDHYGHECKCCGQVGDEFLTLDHINGNGREHRRQLGVTAGDGTYRWLIKNGYSLGFQVLCWNCNHAKYVCGQCPHQALGVE